VPIAQSKSKIPAKPRANPIKSQARRSLGLGGAESTHHGRTEPTASAGANDPADNEFAIGESEREGSSPAAR